MSWGRDEPAPPFGVLGARICQRPPRTASDADHEPLTIASTNTMKNSIRYAVRSAVLVALAIPPASASEFLFVAPNSVIRHEAETAWIVDRADNICGLDDPRMLSKPARVDYDALLAATSEMRKIKDDKIDPNSPQGIQLRQTAATRVQAAVDKMRVAGGYCSVWKSIRHRDGRTIPDITESVKAQL
jgi:hypothetical protein